MNSASAVSPDANKLAPRATAGLLPEATALAQPFPRKRASS